MNKNLSIINNGYDSNELKEYGSTFQYKLVYLLLTDKKFFERIYDILNYKLFTSDSVKWIVKKLKYHYDEFRELPDVDNFKIYITKEIENKTTKTNIVYTLKKIYKQKRTNNTDLIKETATDFFKNQNLKKVIFESVDLLEEREYDTIRQKINDAMRAGEEHELGLDYTKDVEKRYEENDRDTISYGYSILDNYTNGGIAPGELAVILAPSGTGKTYFMNHIALRMLLNKKKLVYYNLEDDQSYVAVRLDGILMKESTHNLKYKIDDLKEKIDKNVHSNIIIKDFPSQISNINHFMSHYERLKLINFNPDIVFVDYGDIIGSVHSRQQDWLDQKQKFEELKSMAQQLQIPVITASQTGQQALDKDIVEARDMQRAYAKVAPCNLILGLSRHVSDKLNNTGRVHIAKNRYGPDGITLPAVINHEKGKFDILNPETKRGKELLEKMKNNNDDLEAGKERLKEKFQKYL